MFNLQIYLYLQEKQLLEPKGEKGVENLLPNIYMLGILLFNKRAASSWYSTHKFNSSLANIHFV